MDATWSWTGMAIYILTNIPAPLFLMIFYKKWSIEILAILEIPYKSENERKRTEMYFRRAIFSLGVAMLVNVPISLIFRSDLVQSFNIFWVLCNFTLFFSLSQMQPEWHPRHSDSINSRWRRRNKSKLQMLNIEKRERINYEFDDVIKAVRERRYENLGDGANQFLLGFSSLIFFIIICSLQGIGQLFPEIFFLPDCHNVPLLVVVMIVSGIIYAFVSQITRLFYSFINREIIAWCNEL